MQSERHKQNRELAHWYVYGEREKKRGDREEIRMTETQEAVINNILTRRTIRRFLDRQIKEEELQTILEAGLYVLLGYPKDAQAPKAKERKEGRVIMG